MAAAQPARRSTRATRGRKAPVLALQTVVEEDDEELPQTASVADADAAQAPVEEAGARNLQQQAEGGVTAGIDSRLATKSPGQLDPFDSRLAEASGSHLLHSCIT